MAARLLAAAACWLIGTTALARSGDDVQQHIDDLQDVSAKTREKAAEALGMLGPKAPSAAVAALGRMLEDDDWSANDAAAWSLVRIGKASLPTLVSIAKTGKLRGKRQALACLAVLGPDAGSVVAEISAALKDPDPDIRIRAARALHYLGAAAREALPALVAVAGDNTRPAIVYSADNVASVASAALLAIQVIDPAALKDAAKVALPELLEFLNSGEKFHYARQTLLLLGPHGRPAAETLKKLLLEQKHKDLSKLSWGITSEICEVFLGFGAEGEAALLEIARDEKAPRDVRADVVWLLGRVKEPTPAIVDGLREFLKHKAPEFRLAALRAMRWRPALAKPALRELVDALGDEQLSELAFKASRSDDMLARTLAAAGLEALPALREALRDDRPFVRYQATRALAFQGRKAAPAIPDLQKVLKDKSGRVAVEAAFALLRAGAEAAEALALLELAMRQPNVDLRYAGVQAAYRAGPRAKGLVPALVKLLDDDNQDVREAAMLVLGRLGPAARQAAPAILKLVENTKCPVRQRAVWLLGALGPPAKPAALALAEILKEGDSPEAAQAVVALGELRQDAKDAVPLLIGRLPKEPLQQVDWDSARHVLEALGKIGSGAAPAVPQLLNYLASKKYVPRTEILQTLGDIGPPAKEAVPALEKLLDDENNDFVWAAYALARITGDTDKYVARLVAHWQRPPRLTPEYVMLNKIRDSGGRYELAFLALGRLGPVAKKAVPALVEAARDPSAGLSTDAITALGQFGPAAAAAVPCLVELLGSKNEWTRKEAARSLGLIGPAAKAAVSRLRDLTGDVEEVADAADKALYRIEEHKDSK
jgi:HEAT repeat protein